VNEVRPPCSERIRRCPTDSLAASAACAFSMVAGSRPSSSHCAWMVVAALSLACARFLPETRGRDLDEAVVEPAAARPALSHV